MLFTLFYSNSRGLSNIFLVIGLFIISIFSVKQAVASHIVGGVMTYQCLGNNDYQINLTVYRDCNGVGAPFDQFAPIGIFNASGNFLNVLSAPFPGSTLVPIILNNPCLITPPNVCVERADYQIVINLPPLAGGYTIAYQRCCRNGSAINITNPINMGSTYLVKIPDPGLATCNSSPTFNNPPPVMMCNGFEFTYDLSATDIDGDSLVYEFGDPTNGGDQINPAPNPPSSPPYISIPWNVGFGTSNQIPSNPIFTINSQTGFLSGTPTVNGFYTFAIKIKEYRNGILISEVVRDFLLIVTTCSTNTVSDIIPQTTLCTGLTINFFNNSLNASSFFWDFGDNNSSNNTSTAYNPTHTFSDTGIYTIMLVANPGYFCADTSYQTYVIRDAINASFLPQNTQCLNNNSFTFNALGNFSPNAIFSWNFSTSASPQNSSNSQQQVTYAGIGNFLASLTVQDLGCSETYTDTIKILPSPSAQIVPQSVFCDGLTSSFTNASTSATNYFWDFGDNNTSTLTNPIYTYADSGTYNVMLVANQSNVCFDTAFSTFIMFSELTISFPTQQGQCLPNNLFNLTAQGNFNSNAVINWNFGGLGTPTNATGTNVTVSFPDTGFYPVSVTVQNYGCEGSYNDTLGVYLVPLSDFFAESEIGCQPFSVKFHDNSFSTTPLFYFWQFGDGSFSTAPSPTHTYLFPGVFDVTLTVRTDSGCIDTSTFYLADLITVNPNPTANFSVDPVKLSILNPHIDITDLSHEQVVTFDFDDGSVFNGISTTHSYQDTGHFNVQQIVINEFGCSDTLVEIVWVYAELLLYVPNAFTPDGDNLNDIFLPIISGVEEYELLLFNRWGELFFKTKDQHVGWDGTKNGNLAPIDSYTWKIIVTTNLRQHYEKIGVVHLIR